MDRTVNELEQAVINAKAEVNKALEKLANDFPIIKDVQLSEDSYPPHLPKPANRCYKVTVLC